MSQETIKRDLEQERNDRCVPVAREIMKLLLDKYDTIQMGSEVSDIDRLACYEPLFAEVMKLFLKHNVRIKEVGFIMTLVTQPVAFLKDIVDVSNASNKSMAEAYLWKLPKDEKDTQDLTFSAVHAVLGERWDAHNPGKEEKGLAQE